MVNVERVRLHAYLRELPSQLLRARLVRVAHVNRAGKPRGAHDLIIAATAVATGRSVLTSDTAADWTELPEVTAVMVA